jgi:hypothetical protein
MCHQLSSWLGNAMPSNVAVMAMQCPHTLISRNFCNGL